MDHLTFLNSIPPTLWLFVFLIENIIQYGLYRKSLFPKPLTSTPDMLLIYIIDFLCNQNSWSLIKIYSYVWVTFILRSAHCFTKWLKVGMSDMQEWTEEVLEPNKDFIPLVFFMHVQILWQGQKAVLTIVEFEFFDIFYSKFQLVSTFSFAVNVMLKTGFFCCDLNCKWVTCRSACKRFGNQLFICRFNS